MKYALVPLTVASAIITLVNAESAPAFTPSSVKGIFVEQFDNGLHRWSASKATKIERDNEVFSYVGKWSVEEPSVYPGIPGDDGLVLKSKAAHHAISAQLDHPFDPKGKTLVLSYEVKLQQGLDCGGAYIKLLSDSDEGIHAEEFSDKTPYTIMFGPDRCGSSSKVHFIFRHKNPLTGEVEEKHLSAPPAPKITKTSAVYTLVVRPDQTYSIRINDLEAKKGSLLDDFVPAVNPPKEVDDPEDTKPLDWVEQPKVADPDAVKPAEWDEDAPATIPDPEAVKPEGWLDDESPVVPDPEATKPEEWSDEDDGDWVAPLVSNPKCEAAPGCGEWKRPEVPNPDFKGKWFAPLIDNPAYKGPWSPRKIPNPAYFEDLRPSDFSPIAGLGFELWSMTDGILFDNVFLSDSEADLETFLDETYRVKAPLEAALEAKDKPAETDDQHKHDHAKKAAAGAEPDMKTAPLEWAQHHVRAFVASALQDPKQALVDAPLTGGLVGLLLALVVGLAGVVLSLLLPSPSAATPVKKRADEAKKAVVDAAAQAKDGLEKFGEPTALTGEEGEGEVEAVAVSATGAEGVRTRAKARRSREGEDES